MKIEEELHKRSSSKCELCGNNQSLEVFQVPPVKNYTIDESILICSICSDQIENPDNIDVNHWRCLNDSMWSTVPAVQVISWRMLNRLKSEGWPQNLLDMMYLDDETKKWAVADKKEFNRNNVTLDINGQQLNNGDSITTTKDLVIRGANFTAKRGSMMKNIKLTDNPREIEGRINGTHVVLGAHTVKKA